MKKMIVTFFATGFFSGLSPKAPGTMGTLVACIIYIFLSFLFPENTALFPIIFFVGLIPATWVSDIFEKMTGEKDPQKVVIDEFYGYFLSILFLPFSLRLALIAFILFRFFDILKPFPINSLQRFKGGVGIMIDDLIAGIYANVILWLLLFIQDYFSIIIF